MSAATKKSDPGVTSTQIGQAREFSVSSFASDYNRFLEDFNMNLKENTVCGYTMAQAKKIIGNAPVRTMALDTDDPDYAALMELNRRFQEGKYSPITLISFAFSLGRAIGIRDERARRNGKIVVQPEQAEIDVAEEAVQKAANLKEIKQLLRKTDAFGLAAAVAAMQAMAAGKTSAEAISAGNTILVGAGRRPVPVDTVSV